MSIYRQTPRENDAVNSCWMCDYGRLNFDYLKRAERLLEPDGLRGKTNCNPAIWKTRSHSAAAQLRHFVGREIAILASGRMTNEEIWLTSRLAKISESADRYRSADRPGDEILLSEDRNPNTNGAKLILGLHPSPERILTAHCRRCRVRPDKSPRRARRRPDRIRNHDRAAKAAAFFHRDEHLAQRSDPAATAVSAVARLRRKARLDDQRPGPLAATESRRPPAPVRPGTIGKSCAT